MSVAPIPANEDERLAKLASYGILDTPPEEPFDRIVRIVAETIGVPVALVTLVDRDRQWMKSRRGLDAAETPRDVAFCAHAILSDELMVVEDATRDPRFADNPLVTGGPAIRFYAGAPLHTPDGFNLGTLCAIDRQPRALSASHRGLLGDLAGLVVDEMELRVAVRSAMNEAAGQASLKALKDEFLSAVTHELRTPLTSIRGALGLLDAGVLGRLPGKAQEAIAIAHRNTVRLIELVEDILDMQKLESGGLDFAFGPVAAGTLLREACEGLRAVAAERKVSLDVIVEHDAVITSDGRRLHQALAHLISNAVKFSPAGETVAARVTRREDTVRFSVVDRGPGIPEVFRPHLFQKFRQGPIDPRPKGTGLGLAITKTIVDALGGRLHVDSIPGRGATFHIDLPLRPTLTAARPN